MNKTTEKRYIEKIKECNRPGVIEEKLINAIKNALRRDYHSMTSVLEKSNFTFNYKVTTTQAVKGENYLIKKHLKLNGSQRASSNIKDECFINAIKLLKSGYNYNFTFDGFKDITDYFYKCFEPVYTLYVGNYKISYFHYNGRDYLEEETKISDNIYAYTL